MPLEEINFHRIITAVEGPIHLVDCRDESACNCDQLDYCNIRNPMEFIQLELTRFFNNITMADFKNRFSDLVPLVQIQGLGTASV
jgi:DNA-binding IscR family transcriptional regulator